MIPSRSANQGAGQRAGYPEASSRPAFEKHVLHRVQPGTEEPGPRRPFPQMPPGTDGLSMQRSPNYVSSPPRTTDYLDQDIPMTPFPAPAPGRFNAGTGGNGAQLVQQRAISQPMALRPLSPGVRLRGNRYQLQESLERQEWLSGAYEMAWLGQDAHRRGAQVMICEVVLPEPTSVMTQTLLRTATMSLVTVGRHRNIPALWDAFSDQGRAFFVFELIEGETIASRLRFSGRPMPEQEVIECCVQITEVLELLARQSPPLTHGLIRPEHILVGRDGSYYLTHFSVVLAGGGTQYVTGIDRARLSPYTSPEFTRGAVDTRSDIYALIATAYYAATGSVPHGSNGNVPQAQRINGAISPGLDAVLTRGLRAIPGHRYQQPSELRQELLALRAVSGTLVPGGQREMRLNSPPVYDRTVTPAPPVSNQPAVRMNQEQDGLSPQMFPFKLSIDEAEEEQAVLLPKPEDLPPMPVRNDQMNAVMLLAVILVALIALVVLTQSVL